MQSDNPSFQSLADVLHCLLENPTGDNRRHQARLSAVRRISDFLHRPPCDIPADVRTLRRLLGGLHPAQCGMSAKSLSNIKSNLADALRSVGALPIDEEVKERSPAWKGFLDTAAAKHQVWGLSRFTAYCCNRGIEPQDVTQETVLAYRNILDSRLLTKEPADHCKSMIQTWNHLVKRNGLDLPVLETERSDRYLARPMSDYPHCLQKEIDAYIDRLSHADIFAEGGPDKALRPTSLRNIRAHLRQFLDALVQAGAQPEDFNCLAEVITAENIKAAFRAIVHRNGSNSMPSGLGNIAASLTAIARHHLQMPENELDRLAAIKKKVSADPKGMSSKNAERLMQFNDWNNVVLLVTLSEVLMERADKAPFSRASALAAMHAAAVAILLSCPMRIKNLAGLDLNGHLRPRLNGTRTLYSVRIEGTEVKNGEPIEVDLNAKTSRLLHRYITQYRPVISEAKGTALFPAKNTGQPRGPDNFGSELKRTVYRETGLEVHPHLFRHIAAKLYLKERPGDFETVRRLLKHKKLQTTMDFYAGVSNQWAHDHYDDVVLGKWGGSNG
ncbi:tyrosine-type recombinase/integrase [Leisingera sp. ANG-S5]|uniref:tyrosine-type recombinase/integrase n=1 Tax=Leisingera sp. ANG-S5 TaxID=1577901 RepID=UPI000A8696C9|nr:site-specific integrase [Leisingera sp. ANG-S5]